MKCFDKFPLASSGLPYLTGTLFLALVATALEVAWLAWPLWLILALMINFFRDPARHTEAEVDRVISPADGKVVVIDEVEEPRMPGGKARLVSIFMNIFDVHVNRAPVSGTVRQITHVPGGFIPADRPQARLENEHLEVILETTTGRPIMVSQVAGLVARRIECWLAPGEEINRGERYGMIRFGSRLDVYLPLDATINVTLGQRVKAGVTSIGVI